MDRTSRFHQLHTAARGFIMPNAWDAGSAILLAAAGFPAIGTTSAGIAFSLGRPDYGEGPDQRRVSRETMLARIGEIAAAVDVPVNADLEAGFGDRPEEVAETVRLAIRAGAAGANIEDRIPGEPRLHEETLAAERIQAAREAIDAAGSRFVLTARCDAILLGAPGIDAAIRRSNLYRAAGADCLFTPGISDPAGLARLVREIDGPLNMVLGLGSREGNAQDWIAAGVQRVSLGGTIARAALGLVRRAARELAESGTIRFADDQLSHAELNALFAASPRKAATR